MKNLFKKAHELTRKMKEKYPEVDYQTQFGLYISYFLEEQKEVEKVKSLTELKGTEKQIAWAEDIRKEQMEAVYRYQQRWIAKLEKENNQEEIDKINDIVKEIENIDQAGDWITISKLMISMHRLVSPKGRDHIMETLKINGIF
jgi:hypothetical protein